MRFFSIYFFILFFSLSLSIPSQVFARPQPLTNPSFLKDAVASVGDWFNLASYEIISTSPVPPDFDFWRSAKDLGDNATTFAEKILNDASAQYASASDKIEEFKESMSRLVTSAEGMGKVLMDVDVEEFQSRFADELSRTFEELKEEFSEPLPEDQSERYRQQAAMVSQALNKTEDALVTVCGFLNIPEAAVRMTFDDVKPHMNHSLLIVANLVNNHPVLCEKLLFSVVLMIIPESFILKPILFGFGSLGPVKGSLAAAAQRFFFRAAVKEGSWFSMLQRAAMMIVK